MTASPQSSSSFSPFALACFSLNYILGTGFLSLPWAYLQAGVLFSAASMAAICAVAYLSSEYLLTAMARADRVVLIMSASEGGGNGGAVDACGDDRSFLGADEEGGETTELVEVHEDVAASSSVGNSVSAEYGSLPLQQQQQQQQQQATGNKGHHPGGLEKLTLGRRRIDIPELTQIFLGDVGFRSYSVCVSLYIYGAMWSFTSVFGCALASARPHLLGPGSTSASSEMDQSSQLGGGDDSYPSYVLLYALIVVPMSCLELNEQKVVQIVLTGSRILMMFLMVATPLAAAFHSGSSSAAPHFGNLDDDAPGFPAGAPLLDSSGIHKMLPVMVFAAIFHFSIPALSEQMVDDKTQIHRVFVWSFVLVGALYSFIGVVDAWCFGSSIAQSANVNWADYHGGTGTWVDADGSGEGRWVHVALWARAISFFVVMFPAINVISTFPLHALILGDSLMSIVYGSKMDEVKVSLFKMRSF